MTSVRHREIYRRWKALILKQEQAEATTLDLLAHPDATPAQIEQVREQLIVSRKHIEEAYFSVCKAFEGIPFKPPPPHHLAMRQRERLP